MLRLVKVPNLVQRYFSKYVWRIQEQEKTVYLTFDDGPTPEITPWVLEQLSLYDAKATFFLIGNNVVKHPKIMDAIQTQGHQIGNHTMNHTNAWQVDSNTYLKDVEKAAQVIDSKLFRPPYGKIKKSLMRNLISKGYHIVMWHVLSYDFDNKFSATQVLENVTKNARSGSIITVHDSIKCEENIRYALPKMLDFFAKTGYKMKALPDYF